MSTIDTSFGVLTLASPNDCLKAIGLSLSLKASNPGVPTAVACSPKLKAALSPFFDFVIEERPGLRGFVHKVYLDEYTPFDTTFFLDSDILLFPALEALRRHLEQSCLLGLRSLSHRRSQHVRPRSRRRAQEDRL